MSLQNGLKTSPRTAPELDLSSNTKRKRSQEDSGPGEAIVAASSKHDETLLRDIYQVLFGHDAAPSILNFPLQPNPSSPARPNKKAKIADDAAPATISAKVAAAAYTSLQELENDIVDICAAQISSLNEGDEDNVRPGKRLSVDDVAQMQDVMAFELFAREIITRETTLVKTAAEKEPLANGLKDGPTTAQKEHSAGVDGRTVLSLFGNAPTPRQLFSSLQEEVALDMSLEDLGLPTMLMASKVHQVPSDQLPASARFRRTFGDLFGPPATLPTLPVPIRKQLSNRSASISFLPENRPVPKAIRKISYPLQPLSTAKWLAYGPAYPKRRSEPDNDSSAVPDENELFKSAFCSFAPTHDNTRALVSASTKDSIFWQKSAKRRLENIFALPPEQDVKPEQDVNGVDALDWVTIIRESDEHELKVLQELVETYDEDAAEEAAQDDQVLPSDMTVPQLLDAIDEAIKVLASYQGIRNSVMPTSGRSPSISSPSPLRTTSTATQLGPDTDELLAYRSLKERLATLIARLPPYIVAKFDSEQYGDLIISQQVLVEGKNSRGVMEEDQLTRMARLAAAAAASAAAAPSSATAGRTGGSTSHGQYNKYSTSGRTAQGYQTSSRSSVSYGRSTSGLATGTPTASTARPSHSTQGSYTAPVNKTSYQGTYGQSGQPSYQRPSYSSQVSAGSPQPAAAMRQGQYGQSHGQPPRNNSYGQSSYGAQPNSSNVARPAPASDANGVATPAAKLAPTVPAMPTSQESQKQAEPLKAQGGYANGVSTPST